MIMSIMHVTDQIFASEIKEGLVLVDFWAPWWVILVEPFPPLWQA